jgi:hypothetical protein
VSSPLDATMIDGEFKIASSSWLDTQDFPI